MGRFFTLDTFIGTVAFPAIPKCGQHTFAELGAVEHDFEKIKEFPVRLAFVRCPFDRLVSAFSFFKRVSYPIQDGSLRSFEAFIDWALDSDDEHVLPQYNIISPHHFKRVLPISSMTPVLGKLTGKVVPDANSTNHYDVDTSYRYDDVRDRYFDDIILFEKSKESLNGLR